jgi:hypothetical protein
MLLLVQSQRTKPRGFWFSIGGIDRVTNCFATVFGNFVCNAEAIVAGAFPDQYRIIATLDGIAVHERVV